MSILDVDMVIIAVCWALFGPLSPFRAPQGPSGTALDARRRVSAERASFRPNGGLATLFKPNSPHSWHPHTPDCAVEEHELGCNHTELRCGHTELQHCVVATEGPQGVQAPPPRGWGGGWTADSDGF